MEKNELDAAKIKLALTHQTIVSKKQRIKRQRRKRRRRGKKNFFAKTKSSIEKYKKEKGVKVSEDLI